MAEEAKPALNSEVPLSMIRGSEEVNEAEDDVGG